MNFLNENLWTNHRWLILVLIANVFADSRLDDGTWPISYSNIIITFIYYAAFKLFNAERLNILTEELW